MKKLIRKILFGNVQISEYSNITISDKIHEKVYLQTGSNVFDVTQIHWLLCIEPIVFGVWIEKIDEKIISEIKQNCKMYFCDSIDDKNSIKKNTFASMILNFVDCVEEDKGTLFLFKLEKCHIHHLNFIKRYLLFTRYYKKNGLTFSKFKSFVSAYSYPRQVRLISFRQDDYYNIFPMDLLGEIKQQNRFVFGLRHTNVSLPKIIQTGKLVVSQVSFKHRNIIYELGKHHSSKPPSLDSLPFKLLRSKTFDFYIPDLVENYKEIKILKTKNLGSHMLLWGEIVDENNITNPSSHLFVIHFLQYLHQKNRGICYSLI